MAILVIAEHDNSTLKGATLNAVTAATQMGGDLHVLVAGAGCGAVAEEAKQLPYVGNNLNINLEDHVTEKALDGLFTVLAEEEKKIRENPAARTTDLLKKVFQ